MVITTTGVLLKVDNEDIKTRNLFIPEGVVTISGMAFATVDKKISRVTLPSTLKKIKANAFSGVDVHYVCIPASCRQIEDGAFANCKTLKSVECDENRDTFVQLGKGVFAGCKDLTSVNLPLKDIPENTFLDCKKLEMSISTDIETIGYKSFFGSGISKVVIGTHHKLRTIEEYAFGDCRKLEIVSIDSRHKHGAPFRIDDLAFSESGMTDVLLFGKFILGEMIFKGCRKLTDVSFESITTIPYGMFEECFQLKHLDGVEQVCQVGDFAFCKTQIPKDAFNETVSFKRNTFANPNKRAARRAALLS